MLSDTKLLHKCQLNLKDDIEIIEGGKKDGFFAAARRKLKSLVVLSIDHPLCSKYFKSETTVMDEKKTQLTSAHPYTIHPLSKIRIWYETYLVILYNMALFMNPVETAYSRVNKDDFMKPYYWIQTAVDILCLVDVIVNFFTGYMVKGTRTLEMRLKKIARHYLCTFFIFDVVSSIPRHLLYLIFPPPHPPRALLVMLNIFRLLKIPRMFTLIPMISRVFLNLNFKSNTGISIGSAILVILWLFHFFSCLQVIFPVFMIYVTGHPKYDCWFYVADIKSLSYFYQHIFAVYRGMTCFLGIRGVFILKLVSDYIATILTYFAGKFFMAIFWIVLSSEILRSRTMDIKFYELISQLNEYMKQKQLPQFLKDRLLAYYTFKFQKKFLNEELVTSMLSENLKKEISFHLCKDFISNVTIFSGLSADQMDHIIPKLIPEIFLPSDIIMQSGTEGNAMYFINTGTVGIYTHSGREMGHLTDGAYFGEISLVLKGHMNMRVTSVVAVETTQVFRLNKKDFDRVFMKNKAILKSIISVAERRLQQALELDEAYKRILFEQEHTINQDV